MYYLMNILSEYKYYETINLSIHMYLCELTGYISIALKFQIWRFALLHHLIYSI